MLPASQRYGSRRDEHGRVRCHAVTYADVLVGSDLGVVRQAAVAVQEWPGMDLNIESL